ncbi:MAG: hypothetical protein Q6363_003840 [Candidatus Njordarchaeota archaeon]
MFKKINRLLISITVIVINSMMGLVGEYFGYTVLDKVGIVFVAALSDMFTTLTVAAFTPVALSVIFRDPLLIWKVPGYIAYGLFLHIAFGNVFGKFEKPVFSQMFLSGLFIFTGGVLLASGYMLFVMVGISVLGFGLFLLATYFMPFLIKYRVSMRLIGIIAILSAPFLLVMMDLSIYSFMVINVLRPEWLEVLKVTLVILIVDSLGPLILFMIIWLALDLPTILREVKGKINDKRRMLGLIMLLIILFPITTYAGVQLLRTDSNLKNRIGESLPSDWTLSEMRMSYIWAPIGASGVTFVAFPMSGHYKSGDSWYQAGMNFYLVQGIDIVDLDKKYLDKQTLFRLIILQFTVWLRSQGCSREPKIISVVNDTEIVTVNNTRYAMLVLKMKSYADAGNHEEIYLEIRCYVTYIREISRTGVILAYGIDTYIGDIGETLLDIIENFSWI